MKLLDEKLYKNVLIREKLYKLTQEEKREIIKKLTKNKSERQLAKEIGIPRSTINDWKTQRQNNREENIHVSLAIILRKLTHMKPEKITDWGRIEQIKEQIERILRGKK